MEHADIEAEHLRNQFERVVAVLNALDVDAVWAEATPQEQRVLIEELIEAVTIFPDHLEVTVVGAPVLKVALPEVGVGCVAERWCRRTVVGSLRLANPTLVRPGSTCPLRAQFLDTKWSSARAEDHSQQRKDDDGTRTP